MKKIFLFQRGLWEQLYLRGFKDFSQEEILLLLENLLEQKKISGFSLAEILRTGLDKKTALILAGAYELGKREKKEN